MLFLPFNGIFLVLVKVQLNFLLKLLHLSFEVFEHFYLNLVFDEGLFEIGLLVIQLDLLAFVVLLLVDNRLKLVLQIFLPLQQGI